MGGDSSSSNINEKEYPDGQDDFVLHLTKKFVEQGVSIKVNSWDKIHDKLTYDYWDKYLDKIQTIVEEKSQG